jgi:phosphotransferase system enzyme I (PtsI)
MARWLHGLGVSAGEAAGPVARLAPPPSLPASGGVVADSDAGAEVERAARALGDVASLLEARAGGVSGAARDVLVAQAMMAGDPVLMDGVRRRVSEGLDAPHAVAAAFAEHRQALEAIGGYMAERAADLDDLRDRAVALLLGLPMPGVPELSHPFVLVAGDLAPADTATLDPARVLAIVTERGGPTGHTAILAKQLGIPAVTACPEASSLVDGELVLVDGIHGEVVADPDASMVSAAAARSEERVARRAAAGSGPGRTADGHAVPLLVNVGGPGDLEGLAGLGAEGVGLLRTEFMFLDRVSAPSFEEQRDALLDVFRAFAGRRVVVRTLDVGADKPLPYVDQGDEPNPALGVRGLRLGRSNPELLEEQLRAIGAAAAESDADVWVMAPMVATASEAAAFASEARGVGLSQVGVMIEVPSAALTARSVLSEVDFASIGTNDLAQYTFAADRLAGELAELLDPWQPALLRLVGEAASAGEALGKAVGVCGEAASDPLLALVLVGLGVTSLSMAPGCLADVRASLASVSVEECRELARVALEAESAVTARVRVAELAVAGREAGGAAGGAGGETARALR